MKATKTISVLAIICLAFFYLTSSTSTDELIKHDNRYNFPDGISFCGEEVPLQDPIVYESLDKEIIINTFWHSRTIQIIKRAHKYFPAIEHILDSMNIPNDFKYLAVIESGLENVTSPSGAKGFWQFLEKTAPEYGLEVDEYVDERLHLEKATIAACNYLLQAYKDLHNWTLSAAAYNVGKNGIRSTIESQKCDDYYQLRLNNETGRYVYRILATKYIFENAEKTGFDWQGMKKYSLPKLKTITISHSIDNLQQYCTENNYSYKALKTYNPWLVSEKFIAKEDKSYRFKLPE